jgi:hypothetical protein
MEEIEMKKPYAADYNTCIDQAKKDKNAGTRQELVSLPDGIDDNLSALHPRGQRICILQK